MAGIKFVEWTNVVRANYNKLSPDFPVTGELACSLNFQPKTLFICQQQTAQPVKTGAGQVYVI
jgi:hypothetical protein